MDELLSRQILKSKETINDVIKNKSDNTILLVEEHFKEIIVILVDKLSQIFGILIILTNYRKPEELGSIKFDMHISAWQGANTLLSSLQLLKQGYFTEPQVLCRHSIEYISLGLHLINKPQDYQKFIKNKISGKDCINEAKMVIPIFGQMWGSLSDSTHPTNKIMGTYINNSDVGLMFTIGGNVDLKNIYRVQLNLGILGLVFQVYKASLEYIFKEDLPKLTLWKIEEESVLWRPDKNERTYNHLIKSLVADALKKIP